MLPLHSRLPVKPPSVSVRARARHSPSQAECHSRSQPARGRSRLFPPAAGGCLFPPPKGRAVYSKPRRNRFRSGFRANRTTRSNAANRMGNSSFVFLEMPDDCGCNASQNTRAQQPEHCREAAYRVTNCGKREENQDAGKEVKQRTFLIAAFPINASPQASQSSFVLHSRPSLQFQLGELRGVIFLIELLTADKRGQAARWTKAAPFPPAVHRKRKSDATSFQQVPLGEAATHR